MSNRNVFYLDMSLPGESERQGSRAYKMPKTSKVRKRVVRTTAGLMALLIMVGGGLGAEAWFRINKSFSGTAETVAALRVEADQVDPNALKGEGDGRINILMLGKGGPGHPGGELTDTMMIASIDPVNKKAALLSVPRDLWVTIPGYKSMKINGAYVAAKQKALKANRGDKAAAEAAGIANAEQVVSSVTGVKIHYYAMFDFTAFKEAIDTVGGVTVDVPEDLYDPTMAWENKNNPVLAPKGSQVMDGKKALMYVRSRETSSDFARSERQRAIIGALEQKVMTVGTLSNPVKLSELINTFGSHFSSDMSINDAERLGGIVRSIDMSKVESLGLADPPNNYVRTDRVGNQSVVRPIAGFDQNAQIQNYVRSKLRDGYLAKENAPVMVVNDRGTAAELKSYGYNVLSGGGSVATGKKTILVDLSGGKDKYTRNYLERRLGIKSTAKLPDASTKTGTAKFVIIVGNDNAIPTDQTSQP